MDIEFMESIKNTTVLNSFVKAEAILSSHDEVLCSISGGADSDIMVDLLHRVGDENVTYVWFDTGMEYQATKDHLKYLEEKYGISIKRVKAIKPIPLCAKEYGQPFLSKYVSTMIERLQRHNFKWEDESYETLLTKYPNAKSALKWWCSWHDEDLAKACPSQAGKTSRYSISRNKYLKEFLIATPPRFRISGKCCKYAKKEVSHKTEKELHSDLVVIGVRKAEGGIRAGAYKNCFTKSESGSSIDTYRPLFWYTQEDKDYYCERFDVSHSKCYTEYGLKRTGCVGCPYGRNIVDELGIIKENEPKLHKACTTVFKDSYEYTRKYREFCKNMRAKEYISESEEWINKINSKGSE